MKKKKKNTTVPKGHSQKTWKAYQTLKDAEFAVAVFTRDELGYADPEDVEDAMIASGADKITYLSGK